jgi:hypothetical protein
MQSRRDFISYLNFVFYMQNGLLLTVTGCGGRTVMRGKALFN